MAAFTREFELRSLGISLKFLQNIEGDVSCVIWDAALVLAAYLDIKNQRNSNFFQGKNVIELGSGVGCVALTAACLGSTVIATDLLEVIPVLKKNIDVNMEAVKRNGGQVSAQELDWSRNNGNLSPPDLLLLADCVYYDKSVKPLVEVICSLSGPRTEVLLTQEMRDTATQRAFWGEFRESIGEHFDVTSVPSHKQDSVFSSPDIVLLKLTRKQLATLES